MNGRSATSSCPGYKKRGTLELVIPSKDSVTLRRAAAPCGDNHGIARERPGNRTHTIHDSAKSPIHIERAQVFILQVYQTGRRLVAYQVEVVRIFGIKRQQ